MWLEHTDQVEKRKAVKKQVPDHAVHCRPGRDFEVCCKCKGVLKKGIDMGKNNGGLYF